MALRFEIVGNQLTVWVNGVMVASVSDSTISAPGLVGMRAYVGDTVDDFSADAL